MLDIEDTHMNSNIKIPPHPAKKKADCLIAVHNYNPSEL